MVQTLLSFLPGQAPMTALIIAIAGTLIGGALWVAGSHFSRSLITLLMVTLGAGIGMQLPDIFHWPIDAWATAAGTAIVMGILGYAMHRVWVGVGFGIVLACWAAIAVWMICGHDAIIAWPTATVGTSPLNVAVQWTKDFRQSLPPQVATVLPFACGAAMLLGMLAAWVWPRAGLVLLHSSAGASLLLGMGVAAIHFGQPAWLEEMKQYIPLKTGSQVSLLLALIAFGAILQWQIPTQQNKKTPNKSSAAGAGKKSPKGAM